MKTLIKSIDPENIDDGVIEEFAKMLRDGKTVIFPTETVYGLGANALDGEAASKIYTAKGRPSDNPLLVHVSDISEVEPLVESISDRAKLLMDEFWPGPLTIVFKKKDIIPMRTSGGLDTVAIRMPSNDVARRLIRIAGVPIAAPSANLSGKPSPTKAEHIIRDMEGRVDGILIGGFCDFGVESTIVDLSDDTPMILRPGAVTFEMLKDALGDVGVDRSILKKEDNIHAKAPGMKYTHYSPNAEVYLIPKDYSFDEVNKIVEYYQNEGKTCAVMCMDCNVENYSSKTYNLGKTYEDIAKNLFDTLIEVDKDDIDVVFSESFDEKGIGMAVMNRLRKSAGYRFVDMNLLG